MGNQESDQRHALGTQEAVDYALYNEWLDCPLELRDCIMEFILDAAMYTNGYNLPSHIGEYVVFHTNGSVEYLPRKEQQIAYLKNNTLHLWEYECKTSVSRPTWRTEQEIHECDMMTCDDVRVLCNGITVYSRRIYGRARAHYIHAVMTGESYDGRATHIQRYYIGSHPIDLIWMWGTVVVWMDGMYICCDGSLTVHSVVLHTDKKIVLDNELSHIVIELA